MATEDVPMRARSLWHETGPSLRSPAVLPSATEVAIAGAGLTGVATAVMLARAGRRVVVFDGVEPGARTTGGSTAKLSVLQGTVFQKLRASAGDATVRAYAHAQRAGQKWLCDELADAPDILQPQTAFTYATTAHGVSALDAECDAMKVGELHPQRVVSDDIGLPFHVAGALRMAAQAQVHPVRVLARLMSEARELGVVFVDGCRLRRVSRRKNGLLALTTRGAVRAERLVVATGFPVIDRAMFFATLIPSRQLVGAYRLPAETPLPDGMFLSADPVVRSVRTASDARGRALLLASGDAFVPGRADTQERLASLDAWVEDHFGRAERTHWWAAQDHISVDNRPFFGPVPATGERVLAAAGFAKWGMTNAVAAALSITGQIVGDAPEWSGEFDDAGVSVRGALGAVGASGPVARDLVRGWVRPRYRYTDAAGRVRARISRRAGWPIAESMVDGAHCTVSGVCTHMGGVLNWNAAERTWDCPLHGSRFAPDGRVLEGPAKRDLRAM